GTRVVGISFSRDMYEAEGVIQPPQILYDLATNDLSTDGAPAVDSVTISEPKVVSGRGQTASREKIFVCTPGRSADEEPCAVKILSVLARRAYRRPVSDRDVQTLIGFYKTGRSQGTFDAGIRSALERMLVDPDFLFRVESDPEGMKAGTSYRVSDLQ